MIKPEDEEQEGHAKEWQDRARVVLDAKEKVREQANPNQSPEPESPIEDVEEKSRELREKNNESY